VIRGREVEAVLAARHHRPWPLPATPWVMVQEWRHLLFAHWPVDADAVARLLPRALALDTFDGRGWLTVSPFLATVRPRGLPPLPLVSRFAELNARTYVVRDGRPGVFFFSLDATSVLAVAGARVAYGLPYFPARADTVVRDGEVRYRLRGWRRPWRCVDFTAAYRPVGPIRHAQPGTVDEWLAERYCLHTVDRRGVPWTADIHHRPWPLQPADATVDARALARAAGVELPGVAPLVHYAHRLDVLVWPPRRS